MILTHHGNGLNVIVSVPVKASKGSGNSIDLVYSISKNYFRGKETIQLEMKDMRISNGS